MQIISKSLHTRNILNCIKFFKDNFEISSLLGSVSLDSSVHSNVIISFNLTSKFQNLLKDDRIELENVIISFNLALYTTIYLGSHVIIVFTLC